jgi:hypothetical protein
VQAEDTVVIAGEIAMPRALVTDSLKRQQMLAEGGARGTVGACVSVRVTWWWSAAVRPD